MSRPLIAALALTLTAGSAQAASSAEDVVLVAINACIASEGGSSIADTAPGLGFRPSAKAADRYVRNLPGVEIQLWVFREPKENGRVMNVCSVGVWGPLRNGSSIKNDMLMLARSRGYTVKPEEPRAKGGVTQTTYRVDGNAFHALSGTFIPGRDPAEGATYVIAYGWLK
ncbi:MAG: hypothetical protein Q8L66_15740 [Caulobacter sp.]|nr:hypothetical protein [Caulobacter sp.]